MKLFYDKIYKMLITSGSCCLVDVYTVWTACKELILLIYLLTHSMEQSPS